MLRKICFVCLVLFTTLTISAIIYGQIRPRTQEYCYATAYCYDGETMYQQDVCWNNDDYFKCTCETYHNPGMNDRWMIACGTWNPPWIEYTNYGWCDEGETSICDYI